MPKGPPPSWSRRDCSFDHLVAAAISKGYGVTLVYSGIPDEERAHAIRRGVYRCGRHRGISTDAGRSVNAVNPGEMGVHKQPDGTFTLKYRVFPKAKGRASHIQRNGTDRQQWSYNPRRAATAEEREAHAPRNEKGNVVR